jgi:hypothetical protein
MASALPYECAQFALAIHVLTVIQSCISHLSVLPKDSPNVHRSLYSPNILLLAAPKRFRQTSDQRLSNENDTGHKEAMTLYMRFGPF